MKLFITIQRFIDIWNFYRFIDWKVLPAFVYLWLKMKTYKFQFWTLCEIFLTEQVKYNI